MSVDRVAVLDLIARDMDERDAWDSLGAHLRQRCIERGARPSVLLERFELRRRAGRQR